jgi:hypothetical protein
MRECEFLKPFCANTNTQNTTDEMERGNRSNCIRTRVIYFGVSLRFPITTLLHALILIAAYQLQAGAAYIPAIVPGLIFNLQ